MRKLIRGMVNKLGYNIVRKESSFKLDSYYELYPRDSIQNRSFYNIGAGGFSHPMWTNIDHISDWYAKSQSPNFIDYDLMALVPLPLESNSAEIVYTSHTIEHVTNQADLNMFKEAHRILKPGGIFRVTTNNIDLTYRAYRNNDRHFFYWLDWYETKEAYSRINLKAPMSQASVAQLFLYDFASQISTIVVDGANKRITDEELATAFSTLSYEEVLNYYTSLCDTKIQQQRPGWHINWFNPVKTVKMLKEAGFSNVYISAHGQSASPPLRDTDYFDNTHPKVSFYVEAVK